MAKTALTRHGRTKAGIALLEAIIALAILGTGGLSMVSLVENSLRIQREMLAREAEVAAAGRVLAAVTLLRAAELDQRLGTRAVGEFQVTVARPEPTLYRLGIAGVANPGAELLATVVYRP